MAKDVELVVKQENHVAGDEVIIKLPPNYVMKKYILELAVTLNTPAGKNPAAGAFAGGLINIIKKMWLDLDGVQKHIMFGALSRVIHMLKKHRDISMDALAAPAAGASSTFNLYLPVHMGYPVARQPYMGFIDLTAWKDSSANFDMDLGDMPDLFANPNDTFVTSIVVTLSLKGLLGYTIKPPFQYLEPYTISEAVGNDNDEQKFSLDVGDRDYMGILLHQETSPGVDTDTGVITGKISLEGSLPQLGNFKPRNIYTFDHIKRQNGITLGFDMPTGWAYLDFINDGNIVNGVLGSKNLTSLDLYLGLTGGATNKVHVIPMLVRR